jgi:hypothetical protein
MKLNFEIKNKEMNKKNEINKIKESCLTFLDITTINGLKNILIAKHKAIRIIWIIVFIISSCFCMYLLMSNCLSFLNFETKTIIQEINDPLSQFPTIVLCNRNTFTTLYAYQYLKEYSFSQNASEYFEKPDVRSLKNNEYIYKAFASYLKKSNKTSDIKPLDYELKDIMISCEFNGAVCNENNFEWFFHGLYGNCYTFNINSSLKSYRSGKKRGLTIELFVGIYDELDKFTIAKGLAVIVNNNSNSNAFLSDGIFVTTGKYFKFYF